MGRGGTQPSWAGGFGAVGGSTPVASSMLRGAAADAEDAALAVAVAVPADWTGPGARAYADTCARLARQAASLARSAGAAAAVARAHEVEVAATREALRSGGMVPV